MFAVGQMLAAMMATAIVKAVMKVTRTGNVT